MDKELIQFIHTTKRELNFRHFGLCLLESVFIFGALSVVLSLSFVLMGYAVNKEYFLPLFLVLMLFSFIRFYITKWEVEGTSRYLDAEFKLKDRMITAYQFQRQELDSLFINMQIKETVQHLRSLDLKLRPFRYPRSLLWLAIAFSATSFLLSLLPDSLEIQNKHKEELTVLERTALANEALKDEIEKLKEDLTEDEKELFEKSELAKLIDKLEKKKDKKEALKQYAEVEDKLKNFTDKNKTKEEEKLANNLGKDLKNKNEFKELGLKLENKEYKKASADLSKLKDMKNKSLKERMKEFKKLENLSKNIDKFMKQSKYKNSNLKNKLSDFSKSTDQLAMQMKLNQKQLDELSKLQNAQKLSKAEQERLEELLKECKSCQNKMGQCSSKFDISKMKLSKSLGDLETKKKFLSRLDKMKKMLSLAQSSMSNGMGINMPGGKKAGKGVDDSKRNVRESDEFNKSATMVDGLRGLGPSEIAIEDASSGTGVSRIGRRKEQKSFEYQVESLIQREDIPDQLKKGVKNYFDNVHNIEQ